MSFHQQKRVKTRKAHKCFGCYAKIEAGEEAEKFSGKEDDDFYSGYLCIPCHDHVETHRDDYRDGIWQGEIGEHRREHGAQASA